MRSKPIYTIVGTILVSGIVLVHGTSGTAHADTQKPVKTREMHGDGGPGPAQSLDALWTMSPLIVDAVIKSVRPADQLMRVPGRPSSEDQIWVQTAYQLEINEVFRDSLGLLKASRPIEVLQTGGDRDRGDHVDSVIDPTFTRFRRGERYVLFLKPLRGAEGLLVAAAGAHSTFLLADDATVIPRGEDKVSLELGRHSREDFLNRLRTIREARPRAPWQHRRRTEPGTPQPETELSLPISCCCKAVM